MKRVDGTKSHWSTTVAVTVVSEKVVIVTLLDHPKGYETEVKVKDSQSRIDCYLAISKVLKSKVKAKEVCTADKLPASHWACNSSSICAAYNVTYISK